MLQLIVFLIVFCVGALGAGPTIYWRDAGEFVLTGLYRDIPHQPGSPLYGSVAPAFSLLPGPLAWRVNLFSVFCGAALCALLTNLILSIAPKNRVLGLLPLLCLVSSAFQRQLFTAEVYMLYAAVSLVLINLAFLFYSTKDIRYFFAFAFCSGLGLGAHVAVILPAAITFAIMLRRTSIRNAALGGLFGALGLLIFIYLPLRAALNPPLNSGGITGVSEFVGFVSNSRIQNLRNDDAALTPGLGERAENFLVNLRSDVGLVFMALGMFGFSVLIHQRRPLGLIIALFAFGNFVPFATWDSDPWILGIGLLTVGIAGLLNLILKGGVQRMVVLAAICYAAAAAHPLQLNLYYGAEEAGLRLLRGDSRSTILLEQGWFIGKSIAKLYGRDHTNALIFTPGILYPEAFSNTHLSVNGVDINAREIKQQHPQGSRYAVLSAIFKASRSETPISMRLQPSSLVNQSLKDLLYLKDGEALIVAGNKGAVDSVFAETLLEKFKEGRDALLKAPKIAGADARNYYESEALGWIDLLNAIGEEKLALAAYDLFCAEPFDLTCSAVLINNYALKLVDAGRTAQATKVLAAVMERAGDKRPVIRENLKFAFTKLKAELKDD